MYLRTFLLILCVGGCSLLCPGATFAQGGWDAWTVRLRDGSEVSASPVWSLDDKELRYGFGDDPKGYAIPRSQIIYMSNNLTNSDYRMKQGAAYKRPSLPEADVKEDLSLMADGRQVSGMVTIQAGLDRPNFSGKYFPVLVQKGAKVDLTGVAYLKLASAEKMPKKQ